MKILFGFVFTALCLFIGLLFLLATIPEDVPTYAQLMLGSGMIGLAFVNAYYLANNKAWLD